ncbi:hypothetical protein J5Y04_28635 [Kitasatospora sp. RG8]|uniref:hypothetical protein n=1 Tax=Kitasatospora sp. RG8 TaxID=2820815 RepID=UPI001ADFD342|nr:hypothetical protein [Kitasatospora sp. RG8]MBP0453481.1 hypothetical protein [Kitasatospora sp. RG8]
MRSKEEDGKQHPIAAEIEEYLASLRIPPEGNSADLLLPLVSFPKDSLFDFQITIGDSPVSRIPRDKNGDFQAAYIAHLARQANLYHLIDGELRDELLAFLSCIFSFSSGTWEQFRREYYRPFRRPILYIKRILRLEYPVREYIGRRRGPSYGVAVSDYRDWRSIADIIAEEIIPRHVLPTRVSAAENPLLAIPKFCRESELPDDKITQLLRKLKDFLQAAQGAAISFDSPAHKLVSTYASYGRRWESMARYTIPLDKPFQIIAHEKRAIRFESPRSNSRNPYVWLRQQFFPRAHYGISFADAKSNHLQVRIPDPHVQLVARRCYARNDIWQHLSTSMIKGSPDDERKNYEYYSRYDTKPRAERIWIEIRLRQALTRSAVTWGVTLATLAAFALIINFAWGDYNPNARLNGADVVAILLPVTIAASLLLARETSTLGMRVKRAKTALLMVSLAALWVATVWGYVQGHIVIDTLHQH